ncbi:MAG TPA: hypothetical protein VM055_00150 [Novosphingobium sp.]|nr:hypothetical protein [Novosphingobium sp.]
MKRAGVLVAAALLAGCAAKSATPPTSAPAVNKPTAAAAPTRARPSRKPSRPATTLAQPGLESVIGIDAAALVRMFGPPRLDVIEGDTRKLQFAGATCVLDAYLYPPAEGREPVTTYLDARRPAGEDVDRAGCIAALKVR